jgi:hypothetical protein
MKTSNFWDITPCSPLEVNQRFGGTRRFRMKLVADLATCFMLVFCLAYSLNLKMEATCSSETLADFQGTTWRYIPEYGTLLNTYIRKRNETADYLTVQM